MKKKFAALLAAFALFSALTGCTLPERLRILGAPKLAVLGASPQGEYPDLPRQAILQAAGDVGLEAVPGDGGADSLASLAQEQQATAFAVCLARAQDAGAYLESARALGLPVIFCGERPSDEAMRSYDKCWYVGGSPAKQGELLGDALFEAYLCGMIPDKNADKLVQVLTVTEGAGRDGRAEAALRIFENRGVYSEFLPALTVSPDLAENAVNLISAQLSQLPQTELVLAATPARARAAAEAAPGLPVACFGDDGGLQTLIRSGAVLAAVSFDKAAAARTVAAFARNAADGKDPTDGTEARLDDARGTLVGFSVFSAPLPVAQAGEPAAEDAALQEGQDDQE